MACPVSILGMMKREYPATPQAAERQEKHNLAIAELERQAQDIDRGRSRLIRALRDDDDKGSDDA